jgi:HlyD family secretion protein
MIGVPAVAQRAVVLVLLAATIVSACTGAPGGAPGGAAGKPGGKPEVAPISVGTSLILRDILSPTLSYSGNVQARSSVNLVPKISARLEKLNADIGDTVSSGEVVAELDHAQLDAQVQQSQAAVTAAQAKLDQTQASAKQEDIDAAKAVVDQAQAKLDQARAGGRPEEVAGAQGQLAQAQANADKVAEGARDEDRANLQAAIDQAEAQQDQTRAQLTAAQTALAESKLRLDQARSGQGGPGVRLEDIAQARTAVDTNRSKLAALRNPLPQDIMIAQAELANARAQLQGAEDARDNCGESKTTTTTRNATGTTRSTSQQSCSSAQKDTLDAAIDAAKATVRQRMAELDKVRRPSPFDIQQAELAVTTAETNLQKLRFGGTSDVATLELKLSQSQADVDRLQGSLDQTTASIAAAQSRLDAAVNPDPRDVRAALAEAQTAQANLAATTNADPFVVQNAQAALDQAQAQLNGRLRPFTEQDIQVAASGVDQAVAALEASRVQAQEAIIRAPFDSVVSQKLINPGAMASPSTPIVALVSKDVEVQVQVEEARIGQIQKGQSASLSVSAFPGTLFPALVAAISPAADPKSRTFAVRVVPQEQNGSLRDGMFAQVSITGVGSQALLVPNDAIVTRAGRSQVFVVVNDRVQAREVRLGETDGKRTVILDGTINQGDEVVVTNPEALTDGAAVVVEQRNIEPSVKPIGPSGAPAGGAPSSPRGDLPGGTSSGSPAIQGSPSPR